MVRIRYLGAAGLTLLALSLAPVGALAVEGVNLSWDNCFGEGSGVQNQSFACDTNSGSEQLFGSFVLGADVPLVDGIDSAVRLVSAAAVLPEWWRFKNPGSCRLLSLSVNDVFDPEWQVCQPWAPGGAGIIAYYCIVSNPCFGFSFGDNVAEIHMSSFVTGEALTDLPAGVEHFVFRLMINHAKSVGSGACGGCSTPACMIFTGVNVGSFDINVEDRLINTPTSPGSNLVTWQGGAVPITRSTVTCPGATPTRNSTWGSVKSMYR